MADKRQSAPEGGGTFRRKVQRLRWEARQALRGNEGKSFGGLLLENRRARNFGRPHSVSRPPIRKPEHRALESDRADIAPAAYLSDALAAGENLRRNARLRLLGHGAVGLDDA